MTEQKSFADTRRGLAAWLMDVWRRRMTLRERVGRTLEVVETLPVGARRQLMLIRCGEEYFLVGGGLDSIQAMVKVEGVLMPQEGSRCE